MKKLFVVLLIACVSTAAMAQYTGPAGRSSQVTVKEALELSDDAYVTMTGKITEHLGDDNYMFTDGTGTIKAEIDDKLWRTLTVSDGDTVVITGEIDKGFTKIKVDVDKIVKQ